MILKSVEISDELAKDFGKKIEKQLKFPSLSKAYKLDYERFINELNNHIVEAPLAEDFCLHMIAFAEYCQIYLENQGKDLPAKKKGKLELACYKALKSEISQSTFYADARCQLFIPEDILKKQTVINNANILLYKCLSVEGKEKQTETDGRNL